MTHPTPIITTVSDSVVSPSTAQKKRSLFANIKKAIKSNLLPGLILQCFAVLIVVLYYIHACDVVFNKISEIKQSWGFGFSALSQCIFAGVIVQIIIYIKENQEISKTNIIKRIVPFWQETLYLIIFWALKGIEVDAFYRLQALLFGSNSDAKTIVLKVVVDQFIYSPPWGTISVPLVYMFKDCGFCFSKFVMQLKKRELWTFQLPSVIVSGWSVWICAASLIYCLPSQLQIPLFNLVSCFWALLMVVLAPKDEEAQIHVQLKHDEQANPIDKQPNNNNLLCPQKVDLISPTVLTTPMTSTTLPNNISPFPTQSQSFKNNISQFARTHPNNGLDDSMLLSSVELISIAHLSFTLSVFSERLHYTDS